MSGVDAPAPWRIAFDNARDPYTARNALGAEKIGGGGGGGGAPDNAEYIVAATDATLTAERVLTNTATITWDFTTPGQAKASTAAGGGNVSSSGTITVGQIARWASSTTIESASLATLAVAPNTPEYITAVAHSSLAAERVLTDTATITWDFGTAGQAKANVTVSYQPADATLTALAAYNTNGLLTQTAADTFTGRTLTGPAAGITVSNGNGVAGNPTLALADDLAALEALAGTNTIYYRSGTSAWTAVTIGTNLTFTGGTLSATAGGGGDVFLANANSFSNANNYFQQSLTIGHTANLTSYRVEINQTSGKEGSISKWSNDAVGPRLSLRKSRGAAAGTYAVTSAADVIGEILFVSNNGGAFYDNPAFNSGVGNGLMLQATAPAAPFGSSTSTDLRIWTCSAANTNMTEKVRIWPSGGLDLTVSADPGVGNLNATNYPAGAWTAWTPTITAASGTITSTTLNRARYTRAGKTITAHIDFTITNAGSGAGAVIFTLPVAASASGGGNLFGQEIAVTGVMVGGRVGPSDTTVGLVSYANTTVISASYRITATVIYEGV